MVAMNEQHTVGLILAGGESSRLNDKCWQSVGGVPMITRVLQAVAPVTDQVLVVGGDQAPNGIQSVPDEQPGTGPLAAIATGMRAAAADLYLVASCDIPFITTELLQYLVDAARGVDAVVPTVADRDQPLCAVYARGCLPAIGQALSSGRRRVDSFFADVQVRRIAEAELAQFGSPERLFFNVNTPHDLAQAQQMIVATNSDNLHNMTQ